MKTLAIIALTLISQSALADGTLVCHATSCKDVNKPVNAASWCSDDLNVLPFTLVPAEAKTDMSTDSEQHQTYTFNAEALKGMIHGDAISGMYEDGYEWIGGYYARFQAEITCVKID